MHIIEMKITWDPVKAKSNRLKHRVFFSELEAVFYDPNAISIEDMDSIDESRFIVIGHDALGRLVVVVYTYRDTVIRIISARKASKTEQKVYEKGIRF
ncbi:MAG: BrnT family toxin [Xanthomonadales bacterium]|nr:BrnT family toxin [Xanthomonadales bacterium]